MSVTAPSARRLPYRRAGIAYLLAILLPTLALCYLGLSSINTQIRTLDALATVNARLKTERLVSDIEAMALPISVAWMLASSQLAGFSVSAPVV